MCFCTYIGTISFCGNSLNLHLFTFTLTSGKILIPQSFNFKMLDFAGTPTHGLFIRTRGELVSTIVSRFSTSPKYLSRRRKSLWFVRHLFGKKHFLGELFILQRAAGAKFVDPGIASHREKGRAAARKAARKTAR